MNVNELQGDGKLTIKVCGEEVKVDKGAEVAKTLRDLLQAKGIDSFGITVDGEEVSTSEDLPSTFADHDVEVYRSAKVG